MKMNILKNLEESGQNIQKLADIFTISFKNSRSTSLQRGTRCIKIMVKITPTCEVSDAGLATSLMAGFMSRNYSMPLSCAQCVSVYFCETAPFSGH